MEISTLFSSTSLAAWWWRPARDPQNGRLDDGTTGSSTFEQSGGFGDCKNRLISKRQSYGNNSTSLHCSQGSYWDSAIELQAEDNGGQVPALLSRTKQTSHPSFRKRRHTRTVVLHFWEVVWGTFLGEVLPGHNTERLVGGLAKVQASGVRGIIQRLPHKVGRIRDRREEREWQCWCLPEPGDPGTRWRLHWPSVF